MSASWLYPTARFIKTPPTPFSWQHNHHLEMKPSHLLDGLHGPAHSNSPPPSSPPGFSHLQTYTFSLVSEAPLLYFCLRRSIVGRGWGGEGRVAGWKSVCPKQGIRRECGGSRPGQFGTNWKILRPLDVKIRGITVLAYCNETVPALVRLHYRYNLNCIWFPWSLSVANSTCNHPGVHPLP